MEGKTMGGGLVWSCDWRTAFAPTSCLHKSSYFLVRASLNATSTVRTVRALEVHHSHFNFSSLSLSLSNFRKDRLRLGCGSSSINPVNDLENHGLCLHLGVSDSMIAFGSSSTSTEEGTGATGTVVYSSSYPVPRLQTHHSIPP